MNQFILLIVLVLVTAVSAGPIWARDLSCEDPSIKPVPTAISFEDQKLILKIHNEERQKVGIPPLQWDDDLARHAQGWVEAIDKFNQSDAWAGWRNRPHSGGCYNQKYGNYPENISSGSADARRAVQMWFDESPYYDRDQRKCRPGKVCGHYLQGIAPWVTKVGCGHNPKSSWACSYNTYGAQRMSNGQYRDPFANASVKHPPVNQEPAQLEVAEQSESIPGIVAGANELMEKGRRYYSSNRSYYVLFQSDNNVAVYAADGAYISSWDRIVGAKYQRISKVLMQEDGNFVMYDADGRYLWGIDQLARLVANSSLILSNSGKLQVVAPSGDVVWAQ